MRIDQNYIEVVKAVWRKYQSSILEPNDYCLMMRLVAISNDDMGWENCFFRNNYELSGTTKLSMKQLTNSRNKLQQTGLISFEQRNGIANCKYEIHFDVLLDLCKKSKGEGKVRERLGKGDGIDKLNNTTKQNNTSFPGDKPPAPKKKDDIEKSEYWKKFVEVWDTFYEGKNKSKYLYQKKDFACLKKIYEFLKKRSEQKKWEFTEENLIKAFNIHLNSAFDKDEWLRQNFTIPNILSQFNQIENAKQQVNVRSKINTGPAPDPARANREYEAL